jgi:hypothetical protein
MNIKTIVISAFVVIACTSWIYFKPRKEFLGIDGQSWNWNDYEGEKAIIVYIQPSDWPALKPWLVYWSNNKIIKFIGIVDYQGNQITELKSLTRSLGNHKVILLKKLDSSPYALMPMGYSPAAYLIDESKTAQGPYYTYNQVKLS